MNDTIVVFDRIRENAARLRDRRFDRVVNQSINETLSRTILTSATVFFVTLAMNMWGVGVIRDFAFAMNVGVIVGTYSSIFIASPILIWLNEKYVASQRKQQRSRRPRAARARPTPHRFEARARASTTSCERRKPAAHRSQLRIGVLLCARKCYPQPPVLASPVSAMAWEAPSIDESKVAALATEVGHPAADGAAAGGARDRRGRAAARFLAPRLADLRPPDGMADLAARAGTAGARRWPRARRSASSATTTSTASPPPPC